jgi:hypothetical protein
MATAVNALSSTLPTRVDIALRPASSGDAVRDVGRGGRSVGEGERSGVSVTGMMISL